MTASAEPTRVELPADLQPRRPRPRARRRRPQPGDSRLRSQRRAALSESAAVAARRIFQQPRELAVEAEHLPDGSLSAAWSRASAAAGTDRIPLLLTHLDGVGLLAVFHTVDLPEFMASALIRGAEPFLRGTAEAIGRAAAGAAGSRSERPSVLIPVSPSAATIFH